jgi:hypothetical protein
VEKLRYSSGCQGGHEWLYGVVQRPTLHITATADNIQIPGYSSGVADRLALYQATGASRQAAKVLAVFKDGSHSQAAKPALLHRPLKPNNSRAAAPTCRSNFWQLHTTDQLH